MNIRFQDNGEHYWARNHSLNGIGVGLKSGGIMEELIGVRQLGLQWTLTGTTAVKPVTVVTSIWKFGDGGLTLLEAEIHTEDHPCCLPVGSRLGRLEVGWNSFPPCKDLHAVMAS